ncbi:MAG: hypothetical protein DRN66_02380 [Candidatus Nanohalarchaeota archaeon]|nr:MAG: hypothetical protein DRN66_02380 [Candidatus Nanohaloarchaeota archaeon]
MPIAIGLLAAITVSITAGLLLLSKKKFIWASVIAGIIILYKCNLFFPLLSSKLTGLLLLALFIYYVYKYRNLFV